MDDGRWQPQLHDLKERVNALTLQYTPRRVCVTPATAMSPPEPAEDVFATQLRDIKAHMGILQDSIAKCEASMRPQPTSMASAPFDEQMAMQSHQAPPSTPMLWDAIASLQSEIGVLGARMGGLEQDVDFLEDRVDKLEPDQFTPAGSTASQEEGGGLQLSEQKPSEDLLGTSTACLPELCSEGEGTVYDARAGRPEQHHDRVSLPLARMNGDVKWQWPQGSSCAPERKLRPLAAPVFWPKPWHNTYVPYNPANESMPAYSEGVAFRDRELDRMDDQLKIAQESLKSSEELAAANNTTMHDLRRDLEISQADLERAFIQMAHDKRNSDEVVRGLREELEESRRGNQAFTMRIEEQQRKIDGHLMTVSDRDSALRYWKQRCDDETSAFQHSIADRDQALQRWEESYYSLSDAWRKENECAIALGSKLDHYRSDRRKELEHVHRSYEREMDKLKEFCEHKDVVIAKQERVMSRGATLMEEKDAELDRLQRRLRVVEDDMQHETRQQKRMGRLLEEKQTEIERLKSSAKGKERNPGEDEEYQRQPLTMPASTEAIDSDKTLADQAHVLRRLMEPRLEYLSDGDYYGPREASARQAGRPGSPRRRRPRRHESSRHLRDHHSERRHERHDRRPTPPPRPHRHEDRGERFVADKAAETQPELSDRRRRPRFSDDTTSFEHPPLPAPVAARKMASEADLRSSNNAMRGDGAGRSLSKHRSMQELPGASSRRRLQAYVETEGESDAEREGRGGLRSD